MRVNARLDEATQQQLDYLTQATGQSVSHIVRESVAQYYSLVRQQRTPSRFLAMAGHWRSGHSDTASTVKDVLAEAMDAKFAPYGKKGGAPVKAQAPTQAQAQTSVAGKRGQARRA